LGYRRGTQNKMLMNLQKSVADITLESMRETRRVVLYTEDGVDRVYREHEQIYDAIKNQDADKAQAAMRHHLVLVEEVLSEYMDYIYSESCWLKQGRPQILSDEMDYYKQLNAEIRELHRCKFH